jgi:hypothetical protein
MDTNKHRLKEEQTAPEAYSPRSVSIDVHLWFKLRLRNS